MHSTKRLEDFTTRYKIKQVLSPRQISAGQWGSEIFSLRNILNATLPTAMSMVKQVAEEREYVKPFSIIAPLSRPWPVPTQGTLSTARVIPDANAYDRSRDKKVVGASWSFLIFQIYR